MAPDATPPLHRLDPPAGMAREVGLLFAQLEVARRATRETIHGLPTAALDARLAGCENTIGELVFHVAGSEHYYVHRVVLGEATPDAMQRAFEAAQLGSPAARGLRGHEVGFYLAKLDEVRAATEAACWKLADEDLERECALPHDGARCTIRWALAHLADHEAHHRGQIELLRRTFERGAERRGRQLA